MASNTFEIGLRQQEHEDRLMAQERMYRMQSSFHQLTSQPKSEFDELKAKYAELQSKHIKLQEDYQALLKPKLRKLT